MSRRMDRASEQFSVAVRDVVLLKRDLDDSFYDDLLDVLIGADVGMKTAEPLVTTLRRRVKDERIADAATALEVLKQEMTGLLQSRARTLYVLGHPSVVLVVGVNGNGKTTTIGKLAHRMREDGSEEAAEPAFLVVLGEGLELALVEPQTAA